MKRPQRAAWIILALSAPGSLAPSARGADAAQAQPGAARLTEMKDLAREIALSPSSAGRSAPAELLAEPLVRYDDPPRQIEDATLWVWGARGRPLAALKVELYPERLGLHGLVSLSSGPITAEGRDGWHWSSQKPGGGETFVSLDGREIWTLPDADPPADRDTYMNRWVAERPAPH